MKIETKFDIGDTVYFYAMLDKIHILKGVVMYIEIHKVHKNQTLVACCLSNVKLFTGSSWSSYHRDMDIDQQHLFGSRAEAAAAAKSEIRGIEAHVVFKTGIRVF